MKNWKDIKEEIKYAIDSSDLHMTSEIPYEGAYFDDNKTTSEKEKLYNKIKFILKDDDKEEVIDKNGFWGF